jgi:hypothetical protein
MTRNSTMIFRGFKVERYARADSALVYTDYCYTAKKYTELCAEYAGLIRNAGPVRNVRVPTNNEFQKVVEARSLKSDAQKEFKHRAAENYGSYEEYKQENKKMDSQKTYYAEYNRYGHNTTGAEQIKFFKTREARDAYVEQDEDHRKTVSSSEFLRNPSYKSARNDKATGQWAYYEDMEGLPYKADPERRNNFGDGAAEKPGVMDKLAAAKAEASRAAAERKPQTKEKDLDSEEKIEVRYRRMAR